MVFHECACCGYPLIELPSIKDNQMDEINQAIDDMKQQEPLNEPYLLVFEYVKPPVTFGKKAE